MKTEKIIKNVEFTCDFCSKEEKDGKDWYVIDEINSIDLRLYEKHSERINNSTKNYVGRQERHFCSKVCILKYLQTEAVEFVQEIKPPANRGAGVKPLT